MGIGIIWEMSFLKVTNENRYKGTIPFSANGLKAKGCWRGAEERISSRCHGIVESRFYFCYSKSRDLKDVVWDMENRLTLISQSFQSPS